MIMENSSALVKMFVSFLWLLMGIIVKKNNVIIDLLDSVFNNEIILNWHKNGLKMENMITTKKLESCLF